MRNENKDLRKSEDQSWCRIIFLRLVTSVHVALPSPVFSAFASLEHCADVAWSGWTVRLPLQTWTDGIGHLALPFMVN